MWFFKSLHVSTNKANNMCKIQTNVNEIKKFVDESTIQGGVDEKGGPHEIMENNTILVWHKGRLKILHVG